MPRLQLALDTPDLQHALAIIEQVSEYIDIIEVGTILCLSEGLNAIRTIRRLYPNFIIVGDVRIVRAGAKIAEMVFDAGASLVTVVAEAPTSTLEAATQVAQEYGTEVQVELGNALDDTQIKYWQELHIQQVIYHSITEINDTGQIQWPQQSIDMMRQLCQRGFHVTAAGGINSDSIAMFAGIPLSTIVAGRTVWDSELPEESARAIKEAINTAYA